MQGAHINLIDVGTLFAVDLDVDEQLVHHARGSLILKKLVRHDMAPVAGGVADRQQDRLIRTLGLPQRLRPPGPPVDRIVLVLKKVRRRRLSKAIHVSGVVRKRHCPNLA